MHPAFGESGPHSLPLGTLQAELASQQSFEYLRYALNFEWFGEDLLTECSSVRAKNA